MGNRELNAIVAFSSYPEALFPLSVARHSTLLLLYQFIGES